VYVTWQLGNVALLLFLSMPILRHRSDAKAEQFPLPCLRNALCRVLEAFGQAMINVTAISYRIRLGVPPIDTRMWI